MKRSRECDIRHYLPTIRIIRISALNHLYDNILRKIRPSFYFVFEQTLVGGPSWQFCSIPLAAQDNQRELYHEVAATTPEVPSESGQLYWPVSIRSGAPTTLP